MVHCILYCILAELCFKNPKQFWKTWKTEFKIKDKTPSINGISDDASIADIFAKNIERTCLPNCPIKDAMFKMN